MSKDHRLSNEERQIDSLMERLSNGEESDSSRGRRFQNEEKSESSLEKRFLDEERFHQSIKKRFMEEEADPYLERRFLDEEERDPPLEKGFTGQQKPPPSLERNVWWIKIRKIVVTGILLYLIYYAATSIAAYLSAPRLDMTMSPLAGATAVTIAPAKKSELVSTVTYTGTVIPRSVVKVFPRIEGWLDEIFVDVGDTVVKGEVLVRLDEKELLTTLAERKAHRVYAEREYQRDARLVKEGAISQSEADRSQMMFEQAKAKEEKIKTLLSYTEVTSPIDGIVTDRKKLINPGELVKPSTHLLDLADTHQMRVQIEVAEKDSYYVRVGTEVMIRFPSLPKALSSIKAKVSTVFPQLDPRTRTSTVELLVENPEGIIRADMYVIVDIVLQRKPDAIMIPKQAVLQVDGETVVFTTDTVVAEKKNVVLGISNNDLVEVTEGIKEGDMVIIKGARGLTDFQEVTVVSGF